MFYPSIASDITSSSLLVDVVEDEESNYVWRRTGLPVGDTNKGRLTQDNDPVKKCIVWNLATDFMRKVECNSTNEYLILVV